MVATPRRRLIRLPDTPEQTTQQNQPKIQKLRESLARERAALARWQTRLKRAFNSVDKIQQRIARIEKQITTLGG
jgi:septal ring factor EnvC (AmiA/AmiB activator)